MTPLNHQTEVPSSCRPEDAAFIEATSLIRGCNVVEEFVACALWPLGKQFDFEVDTKESPLSMVIVSMPRNTTTTRERNLRLS
jgi:hypothetical protein